jgi:hypothetical protein
MCRKVLRILIAGISTPDRELREQSLNNLMGFVERHIRITITNSKTGKKESPDEFRCLDSDFFRQHILMLLGEMHEAFMYD